MYTMKRINKIILALLLFISTFVLDSFYVVAKSENKDILNSYGDQNELFLSMDEDGMVSYEEIEVKEEKVIPQGDDYNLIVEKDGQQKEMEKFTSLVPINIVRNTISLVNPDAFVTITANGKIVDTNIPSIVRFRPSYDVINYKESGTGISGYTHPSYAADAAYLGMVNGKVKFKMAGVVGLVDPSCVEILPYKSSYNISYYKVKDGKLYHYISTNVYGSSSASTQRVGNKQSYLKENVKYFSYDGHYFYTSFADMIDDYIGDKTSNAVNRNNPYYNYYQYVSLREPSSFTKNDLNNRISKGVGSSYSVLKNKGAAFISAEKYGVNATLALGLAINESAWGKSSIAINKNNIFGLNAIDSSPGTSANTFGSVEACINDFAKNWMSLGYLSPLDYRYYGPHLGDKQSGLNVCYASDPYWGEKAAAQGYFLEDQTGIYTSLKQNFMIDMGGSPLKVYASASTSSTHLYSTGNYDGKGIKSFPFMVLDEVKNSSGTWYKIRTDGILRSDRNGLNLASSGTYTQSYNYGYVKGSKITNVNFASKISLNTNEHTMYRCGYYTLEAYVDGPSKEVTWTSSNTKLATVDQNGKVHTLNDGQATITASANGIKDTCKLTILKHIPVSDISINQTSVTMEKGESTTLSALISPSDATYKDVTWSSSDTSIASVSTNGKVIGKGVGTAFITATSSNKKTAVCEVTIKKPTLELSKTSLTMYTLGEYTLKAMTNPDNQKVVWSSSNTNIAKVDQNGKIIVNKAGSCTIYAEYKGIKKGCALTVKNHIPVSSISLDRSSMTLYEKQTKTIKPVFNPSNATYKDVRWTSSDAKIASVHNGRIKGIKAGKVTIRAYSHNNKVAECIVRVKKPTISLNKTSASMKTCGYLQLKANVKGYSKAVTWSSSNSNIASVDSKGKVYAKKKGTVKINAKANGITKTCTIQITPHTPVTSISLNKSSVSLYKNQTYTLKAVIKPSNATYKNVTWKSSNPKIASVDAKGKVKAIKAGKVTISAYSSNSKKDTCVIQVNNPSITLNRSNVSMYTLGNLQLHAKVKGPSSKVTWKSSNTSIASVDSHGLVHAKKPGSVKIYASANGIQKICTVKVNQHIKVKSVSFNTKSIIFNNVRSYRLKVNISPSNATYQHVTFKSGNPKVATVDKNGLVKAKGKGITNIYVSTKDKIKAVCRVEVWK